MWHNTHVPTSKILRPLRTHLEGACTSYLRLRVRSFARKFRGTTSIRHNFPTGNTFLEHGILKRKQFRRTRCPPGLAVTRLLRPEKGPSAVEVKRAISPAHASHHQISLLRCFSGPRQCHPKCWSSRPLNLAGTSCRCSHTSSNAQDPERAACTSFSSRHIQCLCIL